MRQMKDSGIEWIGKIPETWEVKRLKNLCTSNESMIADGDWIESPDISDEGIRYYTTGNIGDGVFKNQGNGFISESTFNKLNCTAVYPGDLVFSRLNNPIGRACIIPNNYPICIVAVDNVIVRPDSKYDKRFLVYISMCPGYQETNMLIARGTTMQRMSRSQLQNVDMPIPPLADQQRIADYLDENCGEIDSLIGLQEQMIEKLKTYKQSVITEVVTKGLNPNVKLVPSGVDWIGEIPEGWKVLPIKRICRNITDGSHFSPSTAGEGKPYITVSNVYGDEVHVEEAAKISFDDFSTLVANGCQPPTGSVLLAKDGTVGRTAVVYDNDYVVLSSLGILTPSNTVLSKYLKYLLDSDSLQAQMQLAMAGSALRRITITKICKFVGLLPPLNEQQVIIFYLDEKCSDIDRLIEMKQQKIEKLKDYKKSVIYEAVTGKISIES